MLFVDDQYFDGEHFSRLFELFEQDPVLRDVAGKRFAVRLSDPAFWIALCLYLKKQGGTAFPLPADAPEEAALRRAQRSGCHYLLFGENGEAALRELRPVAEFEIDEGDSPSGLIQMSSGTTGEPKYIERSWASIDEEVASYVSHFSSAADMTPVVACPTNHSYGLISGVLVALARGIAPIIIRNLNPKYVLRKLSEVDKPLLYSSPSLLSTISLLVPQNQPIYAVMTSGSTMPRASFEKLRPKVRILCQQYGCSEVGCVSVGESIVRENDVGKPLPHLELMTGLSKDSPREILLKVRDKVAIETRDLGYLEEGRLHFVSRLDDMINVSGLNVYPTEVEEVVLQMPGMIDAVVFKKSHESGSDQVCLMFVSVDAISHHDVRAWCSTKLSGYQVPMSVTRVESIPRLPNGKISRKTLAQGTNAAPHS